MGEDGLWHLHCSGMNGPQKPDNSSAHGLSSSGRGIQSSWGHHASIWCLASSWGPSRKQGWYPHYWNPDFDSFPVWEMFSFATIPPTHNPSFPLSLSFFPSLPQMSLPLESPGKIPLGARNLEGKSLGTTSGIPLMVHSKELCPGGFNDNASGASWSCLRENSCQLPSA